jgi:hypothetical protein
VTVLPVSVLLLALPASAARTPGVAVFELEDGVGQRDKLMASLTDYLRVKLAESGSVEVVDKGEQEAERKKLVVREQQNSYRPLRSERGARGRGDRLGEQRGDRRCHRQERRL